MSDIAAHLGQKNETIERLLAENIGLRNQLTQAIAREQKIASAGEKVALRLKVELQENESLRADVSHLKTLLCEAAGGHQWVDREPDGVSTTPWQECVSCGAGRVTGTTKIKFPSVSAPIDPPQPEGSET